MDRKLAGLAIAGLVFTASSAVQAQTVTDEVDRFTGNRIVGFTVQGQRIEFGKPLVSVKAQTGPDAISAVTFMVSPELGRYARQTFKYLQCHTVDWLVDGRPLNLGVAIHSSHRADRVLLEFIRQVITPAQLAEIGRGHVVEYRICGDEFRLNDQEREGFRQVALRLGAG